MGNLGNAHGFISQACANLSSLMKIMDEEMFDLVLRALVRPLCQLNIPTGFLVPMCDAEPETDVEKRKKKVAISILPNSKAAAFHHEPDNNETRLLGVVLHYRLEWKLFNKGTQAYLHEPFKVQPKQLSKLLSGKKYLGSTDCKKK